MKLFILILAIAFSGFISSASAQKGKGPKKKTEATAAKKNTSTGNYDITPSGLKYKILKKGTGRRASVGEIMTINFSITYKDTVLNTTKNFGGAVDVTLMASQFKGDIMEGLSIINEGDSALFLISTDSFYRGREMPKKILKGDFVNFNVKLYKVRTVAEAQKEKEEKMAAQLGKDTLIIKDYINTNHINAQRTPYGIYYTINKKGNGGPAMTGKQVSVHYTGKFLDGKIFDSSIDKGKPITFTLGVGRVIPGWDKGIALLNEGDVATLLIPSTLGYGSKGSGPIPPNTILMFEVEVVSVDAAKDKVSPAEQLKKDTLLIKEYLKSNHIDAKRTASGLYYTITKRGDGAQAVPGKTVAVHYTGKLTSGKVFDTSRERGEPISFPLGRGQVIPGWDEGIALLKVGDAATLYIPSSLAYGPQGAGADIPGNSVLIFDVELMSVK